MWSRKATILSQFLCCTWFVCLVLVDVLGAVSISSRTNPMQHEKYAGHKVYRLIPTTNAHLAFIQNIVDSADQTLEVLSPNIILKKPVNVMVSADTEDFFKTNCDSMNMPFVLAWDNMQDLINRQKFVGDFQAGNAKNVTGHEMTWTSYHRYQTMEKYFHYLASVYPQLVKLERFATTYEGRTMWLLKLGKARSDGRTKPAIWMDAGIHAREWIASATMTFMINQLVTLYEADDNSKRLLDSLDWYILPLLNVDGFEYAHTEERLWRKTRRMNPIDQCIGADANRNYDFEWQKVKPVYNACSNTFGGSNPYTEPENLAIFNKVMDLRWDLKAFLTFHSHGQLWLIPYGYTDDVPHDYNDLYDLAINATQALKAVYGTQYRVGTSAAILYTSSGTSRDWAKGRTPIKYVYTIELRDDGEYEFLLPPEQIIPSGIETFEAVKVVAQRVIDEFGKY